MSLLADLVAAHKSLCQAVLASEGALGSGFPSSQSSDNPVKRPSPESAHSDAYLNEEEENQLSQILEPKSDPLMEKIVSQQFEELMQQRQQRAVDPNIPKPIMAQQRPRMIVPEGYDQGKRLAPAPIEEVPPEIAMADALVQERMAAPEAPRRAIAANDIMQDFSSFLERNG